MPTILPLRSATTALALAVPTQWADVTLGQYIARFAPEPGDTRRPAEVLCGLSAGYLDNMAADDVRYLANLLAFSTDTTDVLALLPTPGLPDIGSLPYGILLEAQGYIGANPERPMLAHGPYLLALYRVQLAYGKYDVAKVAAAEAALLAAPVTESYADMNHFLNSWSNWLKGTNLSPKTKSSLKMQKSTRGANGLGKGLRRFSGWMRRLAGPS